MGRKSVGKQSAAASTKAAPAPKPVTKPTKSQPKKSVPEPEPKEVSDSESEQEGSDDAEDDDEDDSDSDGEINEEEMKNLMAALKRQGVELPSGEGEGEGEDEDEDDDDDQEEGESDDDDEDGDQTDETTDKPKPEQKDEEALDKPKPTLAESILRSGLVPQGQEEDEDDDAEEEQDGSEEGEDDEEVELDQVKGELPAAVLATRVNRVRINNVGALQALTQSIALNGPTKSAPLAWTETMDIRWPESVVDEVGENVEDDLKRELVFYRQALAGAEDGRRRLAQAGVPFIRPRDYFAEMVKSDEHMERVRQRMLDERAGIKASEEAKRQRELKKFGKKVQVEKQLERQKQKRDFTDKVNSLKRKHTGGDDEFDVQLADAMDQAESGRGERPSRGGPVGRGRGGKARMPRQERDAKYGYGGKKKHAKANTRESTENFTFSGGRGHDAGGNKKRRISGTAGVRAPASKKNRPGKNARAGRR